MGIQAKATRAVSLLMSLNMLMWLTMLTLFAAILVLAAAAYTAMTIGLPPAIAALLTGVALLTVCAVLALLISLATSQSSGNTAVVASEEKSDEAEQAPAEPDFQSRALTWARDNPDITTACLLASGIALAASPSLRRFAFRTAKPIVVRKFNQKVEDFADQKG